MIPVTTPSGAEITAELRAMGEDPVYVLRRLNTWRDGERKQAEARLREAVRRVRARQAGAR